MDGAPYFRQTGERPTFVTSVLPKTAQTFNVIVRDTGLNTSC